MPIAKVFKNGRSQAVRLPKECRFDRDEVLAVKVGENVLLMPTDDPWTAFDLGRSLMTEDFLEALDEVALDRGRGQAQ